MKKILLWILTVISIFAGILFLNCLTPMAADDFAYSYIISENERVASVWDVVYSEWNHYFRVNGRIVAHVIAQTFLWWGKPVFNVFNSMIFIVYISLLSLLAFGGGYRNVKGIISSFLMVWFMIPVPGSVFLWLTGSCNYLWGTTFVLLFIYRYYKFILNEKEQKESWIKAGLWFLFGMIVGWCNENTSGMGILISSLFAIYYYKKYARICKWQITGIVGAIIGFLLMILAPGNYVRMENIGATTISFPQRLLNSFIRADWRAFRAEGLYGILFFIFLFTYLFVLITPEIHKEKKIIGGIWFLGAMACNFAMILSPTYPDRASFGVYSMYFISIFYAGRAMITYFDKKWIKNTIRILICISCMYFSISYLEAVYDIGLTYLTNRQRVEVVISEKEQNNYDILVQGIEPKTKYNVFWSITDWPDYGVERYYGVNSITLRE